MTNNQNSNNKNNHSSVELKHNDKENNNQTNTNKPAVARSGNTKNNDKDSKFVKHVWWIDALLFIGGTLLLGGLATLLGGQMFNFKSYIMPPGTVPKIVFPIAWTIIYLAIGVSTFLMWRDKEIKSKDRKINLILYFVHMFFNVMWPLFFFRCDLPIVAVVWLLFTVITACIVMFRYYLANLPAGIIFSIYTLWLIYALYLNLGLVLLNFA